MPFNITEDTSPKGNNILLVQASGIITGTDAQRLVDDVAKEGAHAGWAILCKIDKSAEYTPDARKIMTAGGAYSCCAIFVTSAILKTLANFMMRVTGRDNRARMFASEADALAWIDNFIAEKK